MSRTIEANKKIHGALISSGQYQKSPHRLFEGKQRLTKRLKFLETLAPKNALHLDAGCGDGFVFECAPQSWKSYGIDVTDEMLEACSRNHPLVTLKNSEVEKIPFEENTFDILTCYSFLDHLNETKFFYKEAMRVLKPGGLFYFGLSPNRAFYSNLQLINQTKTGITEHGVNLDIEFKKAFDDGSYYQQMYDLDPSDVSDCEPGKAIKHGLDPHEEIKQLEIFGAKDINLSFEWILQQNNLDESTIKLINDFSPLTAGCFKYFDLQGVKN